MVAEKHKKSIFFLIKFFGVYFLLLAMYHFYLQKTQHKEDGFICSPITKNVAVQTTEILNFFDYNVFYKQHTKEMSVNLFINNIHIARVIEGCNAMSIIILFTAFIIAFSGSVKATILYLLFGGFLIYGVNLLRIAFLVVMLYKYPDQQIFFHNLVFPAIIYGTTFLLWVFWVRKFSNYSNA